MKKQRILTLLLVLGILLSLGGCGAVSKMEMSDSVSNGYGSAMAPGAADTVYEVLDKEMFEEEGVLSDKETTSTALPENRKLIQTVRMTVETEDMDSLLQQLNTRISELSGYVQGQNVYNGSAYSNRRYRSAEITVRIPADLLSAFTDHVGAVSNVVSNNITVEDITLKYVSTESRMKALQTEENRLLELLAKAETMEDLLTIESRLTEVRWELEQVTSSLRVYDDRVDYATVYLSISEVKEYTVLTEPETVGERISAGWKETTEDLQEGFEDFVVGVVVNIPYILMWLAVIAVVVILIFRAQKKKKTAKAPEQKSE